MRTLRKVDYFLVIFCLVIFLYTTSFKSIDKKEYVVVPVFIGLLLPFEINSEIATNIEYYSKLYSDKEMIRQEIAKAIIEKAIKHNIPVNLAFSLAYAESSYNVRSMNYENANGTFDFGLFQLNSQYFEYNKKNMEFAVNADKALEFLFDLYARYGSYDLALIHYNAGKIQRFNPLTERHLKRIWEKEKELNEWFNEIFRDKISRNSYKSEVLTKSE